MPRRRRLVADEAALLDEHAHAEVLAHALEAQLAQAVALLHLVAQAHEQVVVVAYPPWHHRVDGEAVVVVRLELRVERMSKKDAEGIRGTQKESEGHRRAQRDAEGLRKGRMESEGIGRHRKAYEGPRRTKKDSEGLSLTCTKRR